MATHEVPTPPRQAPARPALATGLERPAGDPAANAGPAGRASQVSGSDAATLCRRTWWVFLLGGAASLAFGALAFANPGLALLVLALFFAAAVIVDGVANVVGPCSTGRRTAGGSCWRSACSACWSVVTHC